MKPLDMREWLEAERLSGMPHADWAAEALAALDIAEGTDGLFAELVMGIERATGDIVDSPEAIVDCFEFRSNVEVALNNAGVVSGEVSSAEVVGLLRMFLP